MKKWIVEYIQNGNHCFFQLVAPSFDECKQRVFDKWGYDVFVIDIREEIL